MTQPLHARGRTDAQQRIVTAFSTMPYGHGAQFAYPGSGMPLTDEQIAGNLERLRAQLEEAVKRTGAEALELRALRCDVEAFRRLIGTAS